MSVCRTISRSAHSRAKESATPTRRSYAGSPPRSQLAPDSSSARETQSNIAPSTGGRRLAMSKCARLNKSTRYHDSGSRQHHSSCKSSPRTSSRAAAEPTATTKLGGESGEPPEASASAFEWLGKMRSSGAGKRRAGRRSGLLNSPAFFASVTILVLVALAWLGGVAALNCYHCSSVDNPGCDEAFVGRANITDTDCEKAIGRPAKVCRKIVQYIEHKKVVIRSCGYIDEHEEKDRKPVCNKRSGTFAIMMESCNCYTDNCNHSASLVPNQSVLIFVALATTVYLAIQLGLANRR